VASWRGLASWREGEGQGGGRPRFDRRWRTEEARGGTTGARAAWPTAGGRDTAKTRYVGSLGGKGWPNFADAHGPHHSKTVPPQPHFDNSAFARDFRAPLWPDALWEGEGGRSATDPSRAHTASVLGGLPPCPRRVQGPRCGPPTGYGGGLPPRCWPHRAAGDLPTGALPPIVSALARSRRCSLLCLRACMRDPRGGRRSAAGSVAPPAGAPPCLNMPVGFTPAVTEVRGPIGPRHRWSLWIHGRWPSLIPRFPGGAAPW
jgi:hypothetical protein